MRFFNLFTPAQAKIIKKSQVDVALCGRSMVEMLGVLAIIGVLSVGAIAGYSKAMMKYKINKTTDQISTLVASIRTLFSSQGDYKNLNNALAIKLSAVPNDMYDAAESDASEITNAFGGYVNIKGSHHRLAADSFVIEYNGLPPEACVALATGDWGSGKDSGLVAVLAGDFRVNSSSTWTSWGLTLWLLSSANTSGMSNSNFSINIPGAETPARSIPMPVSTAVQACNSSGNTGVVAWKYL